MKTETKPRVQFVLLNVCDCFPTTEWHRSGCRLVRIVNAHDDLLEAAKAARNLMISMNEKLADTDGAGIIFARLVGAIAKADSRNG